jgi:hypothetical protein
MAPQGEEVDRLKATLATLESELKAKGERV